ncbi:hypothetical protein AB0B28_17430 [Glycomyces sp. NPDC046736]|uniref:hypothetical protein n=1 Tax=Glycomyces sp. NPDC046736 TaxID=3155615 RepID=UPI0033C7A03B
MSVAPTIRITAPGGGFTADLDQNGARIASILHRPTATEFLLRTPWENEDWEGAYPSADSNEEWHRRYAGGWHTLLPHCGDPRVLDGVHHPFHGEAAWRRWRVTAQDAASCTMEVVLRTVPFTVRRTVTATDIGVTVRQAVANLSDREVAFSWTEHPAFGPALIGPDTTVHIGGDRIEAAFPEGPHANFQEILAKGRGGAAIRNRAKGTAAILRWDTDLLPHLYVWQEHRNSGGFPWWGQTDAIALEPASRTYDAGPALGPLTLAAHATLATVLDLELSCEPTIEEQQ